ncbi:response regulator [Sulfitobacter albidus]|uniref:Response regulator n=1 Tax=Sulfitobacter albidus TaxID=2829501 RepID=A0A975JC30_9RHOB|nr:response regulator [Sulfitobacter albidus]QUJ75521.1 response regulator [Sulfitobacter albidus]
MALPVAVSGADYGSGPKVIQTLLLDDSAFDRARIKRFCQRTNLSISLDEAGTIAELQEAVSAKAYDLILIDYRLPQGDGLQVLNFIQNTELNKDVATIMVTGDGDMDTAVTAMRNGCHDFLTKDTMDGDQLRTAMTTALQTAQINREQLAQMEHQREVIRQGLTAALMDDKVRGSVVSLFKDQVDEALAAQEARSRIFVPVQDHSDLEALLVSLSDDDEFIFD